jgi:4-amino-4-deoxy-L-arabinose transferase-like glycosyltransferase
MAAKFWHAVTGPRNGPCAVLVLFVVLVAAIVASHCGASRPLDQHEIYVAQTASEMIARGDPLIPHYLDAPRLEKPPMGYWLAAAAHLMLGADGARVSELEARLPSLVAGLALLLVTYALALAAFGDRRAGLVAAALLGTSWYFFAYARSVRPEMLYALLCAMEMLGLVIAANRAEEGRSTLAGALLVWGAVALALLTKGPQLPAFMMGGALLALWLRRPRPALGRVLRPLIGLGLVAMVLPYYAYLAGQAEGVAQFWAEQMVQNTDVPLWLRPLRFYYPVRLVIGFLPWAVAAGLAIVWTVRQKHPNALVLGWAIVVALLFVGFAGKLRQHYILPLLPLLAVLAGGAAVALYDRARTEARARRLLQGLILGQAVMVLAVLGSIGWRAQAPHPLSGSPMLPAALPWLAVGAAGVVLACVIARGRTRTALAALVVSALTAMGAISWAGLDLQPHWAKGAAFAAKLSKSVGPDGVLILDSGDRGTIAYYGGRKLQTTPIDGWLAAHPAGPLPYVICRPVCRSRAHKLEGEVVLRQHQLKRSQAMILFRITGIRPAAP